MSTKQIDALKLALEALETEHSAVYGTSQTARAITAIREALAEESLGTEQPAQQEPSMAYKVKMCPRQECASAAKCMSVACSSRAYIKPEQPAQQQEPIRVPVTDNTYGYAKSLAEAIFKRHFASDEHYASGRVVWGVNDTVIGILTQIDNMVADMVRRPAQQQEPVAYLTEDGDRVVTAKTYNSAKKDGGSMWSTMRPFCVPSYTSPPASKPLTDAQIGAVAADIWGSVLIAPQSYQTFARAIEATLGIKGDA